MLDEGKHGGCGCAQINKMKKKHSAKFTNTIKKVSLLCIHIFSFALSTFLKQLWKFYFHFFSSPHAYESVYEYVVVIWICNTNFFARFRDPSILWCVALYKTFPPIFSF